MLIPRLLLPIVLMMLLYLMPAYAQQHFIGRDTVSPFILSDIEVIRYDIFDTTGGKSSLIGETLNALHIMTKEEMIRYEIFVEPGDTVTQSMLDQIEVNLRRLTIFANIRFVVIPDEGEEDRRFPRSVLRVITQDSWSTRFSVIFSTGGGSTVYGGTMLETNLFGRAKQISLGADHSTVNDRGWGFNGRFSDPNFYGSHFQIGGAVQISRLDAAIAIAMGRPFYSDKVRSAFNTSISLYNGNEFFYFPTGSGTLVATPETHSTNLSGWYGGSTRSKTGDLFRWGVRLAYDHTRRDSFTVHRAFENTAAAFGGIYSLSRRYVSIRDVEFNGESLVPVGGMGNVSLGYIGPHTIGTDEVFYIGAEARQAVRLPGIYLYGAMQAGTGLAGKQARYTLERFTGSAAVPVGPGVVAARVEQTNIWNWPAYVFQPLDNQNDLRGYTLFNLFGQNKLVFNFDYRLFPLFTLLGARVGTVAFYDVGGVWQQGEEFSQTKFHNSAGIGLRVGSNAGRIGQGMFRLDLAYNFDERKIAQIIFSTQEAFDVFGTLDYQPPGPYLP